jgi:hypothetical protein
VNATSPASISRLNSGEQSQYLASVVEQSRRYGQDIERSVEELAALLEKKTLECESLRVIASENYNGLRSAVRSEYEARLKAETRQQQELRSLQSRVDALQAERNQLVAELENLREVLQKYESAPPAAPYSSNDGSLFNRVLTGETNPKASTSWSVQPREYVPEGSQRELIQFVNNLEREHASALHAAGVFDFLKVVMQRLCTPLPNGTFSDLSTVVGRVLRERREVGHAGLEKEASFPVPTLEADPHQVAVALFLQDHPGKHALLQQQLDLYKGREHELYEKIHREHQLRQEALDEVSRGTESSRVLGKPQLDDPSSRTLEINARIVLMYRKYNPSKLVGKELNDLLAKYPPEVLLSALVEKYGPEPSAAERRELIRLMCTE